MYKAASKRSVGNRTWTKRDGGTGDVFGYDLSDQVTAVKLDIPNPDTTLVGPQTIVYDANGNRISFAAYGTTDTYQIDELSQYTQRNSSTAGYSVNGNLKTGFDGSNYVYDAQNRLTSATSLGETFAYDGLNRQVSRTLASSGVTTYSVYDGWNLIAEYQSGSLTAAYLNGAGGLVKNLITNNYYYQDGSGSTSHLADSTGHLLEWYRYDLQGTPFVNGDLNNHTSAYGVRHLFTGQQWYSELGLYDLRNRFYSPDIGRFLQPDPIDFNGDATNLYRYCGNNPLAHLDPSGLFSIYFNGGQFFNGVAQAGLASFEAGTWVTVGVVSAESVIGPAVAAVGVVDAGIRFQYGVSNVFGAFVDSEYARDLQTQPRSLPGYIARVMGGEAAQHQGEAIGGAFQMGTAVGAGGLDASLEMIDAVIEQIMSSPGGMGAWVDQNSWAPGDYNTPNDNPSGEPLPSLNMAYLTYVDGSRGPSRGPSRGRESSGGVNWGAAGFPVPSGGTLGPGGLAAFGPDAVFGSTFGPGILGELGLGGGGGGGMSMFARPSAL